MTQVLNRTRVAHAMVGLSLASAAMSRIRVTQAAGARHLVKPLGQATHPF